MGDIVSVTSFEILTCNFGDLKLQQFNVIQGQWSSCKLEAQWSYMTSIVSNDISLTMMIMLMMMKLPSLTCAEKPEA